MSEALIPEDFLLAAVVGSAHGLRGEVVVDVRTDRPEKTLVANCQVATKAGVLTIVRNREYKGRTYLLFAEITSREEAEAARGLELFVPQELEDDAWYEDQLVGLRVQNPQGQVLGSIAGLETGVAQDLLIVELCDKECADSASKTDATGGKVLVPFVEAIVPTVDLDNGYVVVDAPGGLFDQTL